MMRLRILIFLVLALPAILNWPARGLSVQAQNPAVAQTNSQVQSELAKLRSPLREEAQAMLDQSDERRRAVLAGQLARRDPSALAAFLLAVLSAEQSPPVRFAIVDSLGRHSSARIREELARVAASDPEVRVSLLALERLRAQLIQDARDLLTKRLEAARRSHDDAAVARLVAEQERWISLARGAMLPAFLRVPPPRFSLKPDNQAVRVLAFGDFGTGFPSQKQVAGAIAESHHQNRFDLGITLGDNFYNEGMPSPTDSRWKKLWDELYDPLGIKVYASLGNHDWIMSDSPAAEILYSERSPSWRMPSPYYTFTAGPVQFFALDTNEVSEAQLIWLDEELKKSTSKWKLVYGHHPIYSDGEHGDNRILAERLLPVLANRVDVYLTGHDHILNHIKAESGVQFFVSGGGGAGLYRVKPGPRTLFSQSANGFTIVEANADSMKVKFIGADAKDLYEYSLRK